MPADARGLEFTTASAEAADQYNTAIAHYFAYATDVNDHVKGALAADPDFPMGHVLRGYMMMQFGTAAVLGAAKKSAAAARAHAADLTPREQAHVATLEKWVEGDIDGANRSFESILAQWPLDLLAARLVHYNYFWLGQVAQMRDSAARVLAHWDECLPGYHLLLGMLAFGLEETGDYPAAEEHGKRAVSLNAHDHWATHAVAHVMEMQGRHRDGIEWLDGLSPNWAGCNNFVNHLWWHLALYHLELEQYDRVLWLYDERFRKEPSDFYLDVQNAASMLWRLDLRGVDVGDRWKEIAEKAELHLDDLALPFTDLHYLMALLADGREADAARILEAMERFGEDRGTTYAPVVRDVSLPVSRALGEFRRQDYPAAAARLAPVQALLQRTGGSHAQRDVIVQTLIVAALRAGLTGQACDLLAARTAEKPTSATSWRWYAEALSAAGDAAAAERARQQAETILAAG